MENKYYVYAYIRETNNTPYYIGMGQANRAYGKHRKGLKIPDKASGKIVFLEQNLTKLGALALERRYIRWYGRKDNNTGILYNLTDGGEGGNGSSSNKGKKRPDLAARNRKRIGKNNPRFGVGTTNNKKLFHDPITKQEKFFIASSAPDGWILGTCSNRNKGIRNPNYGKVKVTK